MSIANRAKYITFSRQSWTRLHWHATLHSRDFALAGVVNISLKNGPNLVKFDHNFHLFTLERIEGNITNRLNTKWVRFELTDYQNR